MRYVARRPGPPLDTQVAYLWSLSDAPGHARERILPSGTLELVINLDADAFRLFAPGAGDERRHRGAMASGCYARAFEIDTRAHARIVGVHFKPGGAALLGVPPGELANVHVELDALWGSRAAELRERLCAAPSPSRCIELLEHALRTCVQAHPPLRAQVGVALAELDRPGTEVGDVARTVGLSRRRLIEIFTADVGMTPKRYARVRRFERTLACAQRTPSLAWARLALDGGYCDQAHLCRDWMELTGLSPTELVRLRRIGVKDHHVAVAGPGSISSKTRPRRAHRV